MKKTINMFRVHGRKIMTTATVVAATALATAQEASGAAADPTTVTTTATTAFEGVSVLCVAMLGFFIIFRIVKGIRK